MLRALVVASSLAIAVAGCDQLFPELAGKTADLATASDGGTDGGVGVLGGTVCMLGDLRNPATCVAAGPGRHITLEETRAAADTALDGSFSISLTGVTDVATLAVSDGTSTQGSAVPTVIQLKGAVLAAARTNGVALPIVRADALQQIELLAGAPSTPTRGAVLGWVVDGKGKAQAGASATRVVGAVGPLYDNGGGTVLGDGVMTGGFGTIAFLDLPPGDLKLAIAPPASSTLAGDTFTLPIRGGAVTAAALTLPSR